MRSILFLLCFIAITTIYSQHNPGPVEYWIYDTDSGFNVQLYPTAGAGDSLQWKIQSINKLINENYPTVNFNDTGTYKIELFSLDESKPYYYSTFIKLSRDSLAKIHPLVQQCGYGCGNGYDLCFNANGLEDFHAYIFNRWGEIMYESTENDFTWEKRNQKTAVIVPADTYLYLIKWTDKNGNHQRFTGHWQFYR